MSFTVNYDTLGNEPLPRVVRPGVAHPDPAAAIEWFKSHQAEIRRELRTHGALLFRGFPVRSAEDLGEMADTFDGVKLDYVGGAVPRSRVHKDVFNATELTRLYKIRMHNELAYQRDFPDLVFFYCHLAAPKGGETPIVDCRRILEKLDPTLRQKFVDKGLMYVRTFQDKRPLREWFKKRIVLYQHLTWQEAFKVDNQAETEKLCRERGMEPSWSRGRDLIVTNRLPAVVDHPHTGARTWFNQVLIQHFNRRNYGWLVYLFRKALYGGSGLLPNQVYFGDGSPISKREIHHVMDVTEKCTVEFTWQSGDVLLVDNRLVAHGRNPYSGPRKVFVAMIKERQAEAGVATAGAQVAEVEATA